MTISSIMTSDPLQVAPECTLARALELMDDRDVRHLPVVERRRVVGIVSDRDLLEAVSHLQRRQEGVGPEVVRDWMSLTVETLSPEDGLDTACRRMLDHRIGCLPVVEGGRLVGLLTEHDVLSAFVRLCATPDVLEEFDPLIPDVMTSEVVTVETSRDARAALELLRSERIRHLPVLHEGWFVGILSDRDLRRRLGRRGLEGASVGDLMTAEVVTVGPGDRLSLAARMLVEQRFSAAPVADGERLVGIVTSADVLAWCGKLDWPPSSDWLGPV